MTRVLDTLSGKQTWSQVQAIVASAAVISLAGGNQMSANKSPSSQNEYRLLIADSSYRGRTSVASAANAMPVAFAPKTALGKRLMELRAAAIANGMPLLGPEEIRDEIARRRGEIS